MRSTGTMRVPAIAAAALLTALLTACAGQAPAAAPPSTSAVAPAAAGPTAESVPRVPVGRETYAFEMALAQRKLRVGATGQETQAYAQAICDQLGGGRSPAEVITDVQAGTGYGFNDTGFVVGAAVSSFCPQNLDRLPR